MVGKRPKLLLFVVAAVLVLAIAAVLFVRANDGLSRTELVVERTEAEDGSALVLDPDETRANAPALARLLDEAAVDGRATTRNTEEATAAEDYLAQLRAGAPRDGDPQPMVEWKGENFLVYRIVS